MADTHGLYLEHKNYFVFMCFVLVTMEEGSGNVEHIRYNVKQLALSGPDVGGNGTINYTWICTVEKSYATHLM